MATKDTSPALTWRQSFDGKHRVVVVVFSSQGFKARFRGLKATFATPADKVAVNGKGQMVTSYSEEFFCPLTSAEFDEEMWKDGKVAKDTSFCFTAKLNLNKRVIAKVTFPDQETVTLSLPLPENVKVGEQFDTTAIIKRPDGTEDREAFKAQVEVLVTELCPCDYHKVPQAQAFSVNKRLAEIEKERK